MCAAGLVWKLVNTDMLQRQPKTQRYPKVIIISNGYASTWPETQLNCAKWSVFTNMFILRKAQASTETITAKSETVWMKWENGVIGKNRMASSRCGCSICVPLGTLGKCQAHTVRSENVCYNLQICINKSPTAQHRRRCVSIGSLH